MKDKAETQTAVDADRHAGRLADVAWQRIELAGQDGGYVLAAARAAADGDEVIGMGGGRGLIRHEFRQSPGQAGNGAWQITHASAGDVLFIQVVLLEQGEPL